MKTTYIVHCNICKRPVDENKLPCECPEFTVKELKGISTSYDGGYERRRFPMYDEQLDRFVESKQHKRQILKEMGLTQIENRFPKEKKGVVYSIPKGGL